MEIAGGGNQQPPSLPSADQAKSERLNVAVQQQLNLDTVKTRAVSLFNAITRILEQIDAYSRSNSLPKWQEMLGQFSMVNMELFNIVEDIKKVSKPFVVHPKNVNGVNAAILPVMLSSKLLPEMEVEDNAKREQLLSGITSQPVTIQIEKLKVRIDMIASACETAEKVIADARKQYGLGTRQGTSLVPTMDKVQAAKIQEQENLLRAAVNFGEGLRGTVDQRHHLPSSLPSHLVDVLTVGDGPQNFGGDGAGVFPKNTPPFSSNNAPPQGAMMQTSGAQLIGRSAPSPSGVSGPTSFDNASTPPLPYANSPRSGSNMMNTPSPQQQSQQQQQRQKMMQIPQQQLLAQQQLRQSSTPLGQSSMSQLQDLQVQNQSKFHSVSGHHQMQYSQPLSQQQFQNRQLQSMQHSLTQSQINQGNQLRTHLSQFTGSANSALFNAAQTSPNSQMITNMSATMQSQSLLPRMQYGLSGGHPQRSLPSQILSEQMFGMGGTNPGSMVAMQQQQSGFGNNMGNNQSLQVPAAGSSNSSMMGAQNPNFPPQQRQQNQQQQQ